MGPRSVERGKLLDLILTNWVEIASMGPRSVERGKQPPPLAPRRSRPGFNGAAFC